MAALPAEYVVGPAAAGSRLDAWLAGQAEAPSRSRIQALIEEGHVRVDGARARASTRLKTGQTVAIHIPPPAAAAPLPEAIPLTFLFEDEDLVVVDKPAGLTVHPGAGRAAGTLVNALLHHLQDLSGIGGVLRPGIVHRLDRGTSGVLLVAKNDAAHQALARQFAERTVEKEYLAIVLGLPSREGRVDRAIARDRVHRRRMSVREEKGREALTTYRVLEALDGAALLSIRIHTGRTHQIRVHLASIGHPVAGDATYGGTRTPPSRRAASRELLGALSRPALHAARLAFTHPRSGRRLQIESPLPPDLATLLAGLRR